MIRNSSMMARCGLVLPMAVLLMPGCSGENNKAGEPASSSLGGAIAGAGAGAIIGAPLGAPGAGAAIGGVTGGAAGYGLGSLPHNQQNEAQRRRLNELPNPVLQAAPVDLTGMWQGQSTAGCSPMTTAPNRCNSQTNIGFSLRQNGSTLTGRYQCRPGTAMCYEGNNYGDVVAGSVRPGLTTMRIAMPDGSSCVYQGRFSENVGVGGYSCYQGGTIQESGQWKVARAG